MIVQEVFSGTSTSSVFARLQISGSLVLVSVGLGLMYRGELTEMPRKPDRRERGQRFPNLKEEARERKPAQINTNRLLLVSCFRSQSAPGGSTTYWKQMLLWPNPTYWNSWRPWAAHRQHTHTLLLYTVVNFEQNIWMCVSVCLQTEPPSQRHIQIQKELWRIQDVMEALSKNKPQRSTNSSEALPQHLHHHILTFLLACVCLMSWIQFQGSKQFL